MDQDGERDFLVRSGNAAEFNSAASKDEFFSIVENSHTGAKKLAYFRNLVSSAEMNSAVFNNSTVLLAVGAADIGLTPAQPSFAYSITTHSVDTDDPEQVIDQSRTLVYDLLAPGVQVENGLADLPLFYDLPGTTISITAERDGMMHNQSRGVLLLHLHNDAEMRAEEVEVRFQWKAFLPQIAGGEGE